MHCFAHQELPAVCACAFCLKGLCQHCMQPSDDRFVCSSACADQLAKITKINKYAMSIYGIDKPDGNHKIGARTAILYLALGMTFLGYGAYLGAHFSDWGIASFMSVAGLIFLIQGYKTYKRGLRL